MRCKEILAALSDYIDGDLDPELCRELQSHLADCNPCQLVVDNIHKTLRVYKSGRPLELPAELCQRLRSVLRERWRLEFPSPGR